MEMIQESLTVLLITIVCGAISVATACVSSYAKKLTEKAKAETAKIENEAQRSLIDKAINRVDELITVNVVKMEQTLVKEIKEKASDGKVDKKELQAIAETVKSDVLNQLSKESKELISLELNDVNGYIAAQIELTLASLKNQIQK
ncbi:hypothetical protein [uncultured Clostridium sp.]|uniref:hypothetical protein n=1 Tax=uncultured Clostridium sp. TaxID=59620 RepID=UPI00260BBB10|nr:hypothetical protein [uncultured Clostridium sp.]